MIKNLFNLHHNFNRQARRFNFLLLLIFSFGFYCAKGQWIDTLAYNDNYRFFTPTSGKGTDARIGLVNDSLIITDVRFIGRQNIPSQVAYMTYHRFDGSLLKAIGIPELGNIQNKPSRAFNIHFRHHGYMVRTEDAFPPFEPAVAGLVTYDNDSLLWTQTAGRYFYFSDPQSITDSIVWMQDSARNLVKLNILTGEQIDTVNKNGLINQIFPGLSLNSTSFSSINQSGDTIYAFASGIEILPNLQTVSYLAIVTLKLSDLSIMDKLNLSGRRQDYDADVKTYSYIKSSLHVDSVNSTYTYNLEERSIADSNLIDSFHFTQNYTTTEFPLGIAGNVQGIELKSTTKHLAIIETIFVPHFSSPSLNEPTNRLHLFRRDNHQKVYSLSFNYGDDFINNYLTQAELSEDGSVFAIINVSSTESQFALIKIDTTGNYSLSEAIFEAHKKQDKLAHFYPNPFDDHLQMILSESGDYKFRLLTLNGKLVLEYDYRNAKNISISASSITPGFYIYQLIQKDSGKLIQIGKLIKR